MGRATATSQWGLEGLGSKPHCDGALALPVPGPEHNDLRARQLRWDAPRGRQPVHAKQIKVHQDDVSLELLSQPDSLFAICGLRHQYQIYLPFQSSPHEAAICRIGFCDQNVHGSSPYELASRGPKIRALFTSRVNNLPTQHLTGFRAG